jgi:hypothetical protein
MLKVNIWGRDISKVGLKPGLYEVDLGKESVIDYLESVSGFKVLFPKNTGARKSKDKSRVISTQFYAFVNGVEVWFSIFM